MVLGLPDWLPKRTLKRVTDSLSPYETRLVGGTVRAILRNEETDDFDLATTATPETVISLLEKADIKTIPTGIDHGTITAIANGTKFEITTLRKDVSTDGRHATVTFTEDFAEDASRRDFTFNALYLELDGQITDYFHGEDDLDKGHVRFIGDISTRIDEDYLRVLRFFRFYARYGTHKPSKETLEILREKAPLLRHLSAERITEEMKKIALVAGPKTIKYMQECHIFSNLGMHPVVKEFLTLPKETNALTRLVVLAGGHEVLLKGRRFAFSKKDRHHLTCISVNWKKAFLPNPKIFAYYVGTECAQEVLRLRGEIKEAKSLNNYQPPELPITGDDVMAKNIPKGPQVGDMIRRVEVWWLEHNFPDRNDCLKYLKSL